MGWVYIPPISTPSPPQPVSPCQASGAARLLFKSPEAGATTVLTAAVAPRVPHPSWLALTLGLAVTLTLALTPTLTPSLTLTLTLALALTLTRSCFTPHYGEDVTYSMQQLKGDTGDNVNLQTLLVSLFPDEWEHFCERVR